VQRKHICTVEHLTHDWFNLPPIPLECVIRCCQITNMFVTLILLVVSRLKITLRIFLISCHI
jgi:hypothetical protein